MGLKLNQTEFKEKIGLWWKYLEPFFSSEKAWNIYQTLKRDAKTSKITPKSTDTWRFLKESDPDRIKIIIIGSDSYYRVYSDGTYHNTGIFLDCSNSPDGKLQPALIEFWNGISTEFETDLPKEENLKFLLDQGVFLGNRGITCKVNSPNFHIPLWDDFWEAFFKLYISQRPDIPIIFLGEAIQLKKYVTVNTVFELSSPKIGQVWETEDVFMKCNKIIKSLNGAEYCIVYNKKEYDIWLDEIPF